MAKYIKRAGIVFFILVISCLLIVGSVFAVDMFKADNKDDISNLKGVGIANDKRAFSDYTPEIVLEGDSTELVNLFEQAIQLSIQEDREVKLQLNNDWTAPYTDEDRKFGDTTLECINIYGTLMVPPNANITLDLNGYTIDRGLEKKDSLNREKYRRLFYVSGTFTIFDNTYDAEIIKDIYNTSMYDKHRLSTKIRDLPMGKLTGGASMNNGCLSVEAGGTLNFYSGIVMANYAGNEGGGIGVGPNSTLNVYGGCIIDNEAEFNAGAITCSGGIVNIYDSFIMNNVAKKYGAGVYISGYSKNNISSRGQLEIHNTIISHNLSDFGAGVAVYSDANCNIYDTEVAFNNSNSNSAGIIVWGDSSRLDIHNSKIHNNYSRYIEEGETGGTGILSRSELYVYDTEISNNHFEAIVDSVVYGSGVLVTNGTAYFENVTITKNDISSVINDGKHSYGGGCAIMGTSTNFTIAQNVKIYDNFAHNQPSDLRLEKGQLINVKGLQSNNDSSYIGIKLADNYDNIITSGFANNNSCNPKDIFFSNDGTRVATLNQNEVSFEQTVVSDKYDYIYLQNNKRNNYANNNLTHAVNDFDKSKIFNDGMLVLGNISPNTSVNSFIQNIKFDKTNVKLYDSNGKLIFNQGKTIENMDESLYDKRFDLAVGTGWKLETYNGNVKIEEFKLSVLGDINGDGRISASDIVYLRELAQNKALFNSLSVERKLACLIDNRGKFTQADAEIIKAVIEKESNIELYF